MLRKTLLSLVAGLLAIAALGAAPAQPAEAFGEAQFIQVWNANVGVVDRAYDRFAGNPTVRQTIRMLREIGKVENIPGYIQRVKAGDFRLMGFGHRVYKNYDPRARILRELAPEVFEVTRLPGLWCPATISKTFFLIPRSSTTTSMPRASRSRFPSRRSGCTRWRPVRLLPEMERRLGERRHASSRREMPSTW